MNTDTSIEKIKVSDHFDLVGIKALFNEFYTPFIDHLASLRNINTKKIVPRRILGNYLTFLVNDIDKSHSVMIKKDAVKYGVQCDCLIFQKSESCPHIALVIEEVIQKIQQEIEDDKKESIKLRNQEKIIDQENEKKETIEKLQKIIKEKEQKESSRSRVIDSNTLSKPYVIPNARDFSYYRLATLIPSLKTATRRNKNFFKLPTKEKGIDIGYQTFREKYKISFRVNQNDDLELTCTCNACYINHICQHAVDSIYYLSDMGSFTQFIPFTNLDIEKNRLLEEFGLTIDDKEAAEFKFSTDYTGRLSISKVPPHFISLSKIKSIKDVISKNHKIANKWFKPKLENYEFGLLFQFSHSDTNNAPIKIDGIKIETTKKGDTKFSRLLIGKEENVQQLSILEEGDFDTLMNFSFLTFKDYIGTSFFSQSYTNFINQYNEGTKKLYLKYFFEILEKHWAKLSKWTTIKYLPEGQNFAKSNLKPLKLSPEPVFPDLKVYKTDKLITLQVSFSNADGKVLLHENEEFQIFNGRLILCDGQLYINKRVDIYNLLEKMPEGKLIFPSKYTEHVLKNILFPLSQNFGLTLPEDLSFQVRDITMIPAVHLKEMDNKFLTVAPKFYYDDLIIDMFDETEKYSKDDEKNIILLRKIEEENSFVEYIQSLHPQFRLQTFQSFFILPFDDVMKNQWFINFSKQLMSDGIKLVGFQDLKTFKYNNATPNWDMKITSGIDWFDVKITASWGDQTMNFKDIRKAILNGQDFIILGDGSFGMLPEEWIKKYNNLFKFSIDDKEGIKVSKKHFSIVELLFDQIDDEDIIAEIEEKKQKLLHIGNIDPKPIPLSINATLRPYQESGYQWMQVLDEISWGGCLADDMGLGKTLQAITFLAYVKNKYDNPTSLIICPTSLIYNWESELKKFAPELKYHLYYGQGREFNDEHFNDYDIIISSYGIVRNDIENLMKFEWEYVILDESQAIKNPDAISTKAVQLLKARNKLILSGTPLQNNTFDIYAQFNFLNPGLLGSKDFFRREFANPIDKDGNKEAGTILRQIIKPFMLRRTKSEVATDLPEKTEMILWCQMDKAQKNIYDEYKDYYRHALMQKIDTEGMAKAGVYILEGLLRLRQICDDPRLIKDKEIKPGKGVKIQELTREITENIGEHKMLIFSQFTEMLSLIKEELDNKKLKYCYLDGGTPATKRQEQVEIFQNQKNINIFLISLKAGGVGLNLTEADYVYIVDPWWNPAVEQQAIDRTHRIGQKNKIFAYKMICKDTVEEKIIMLQEKKLNISNEIVQEDTAFFKSLTKEDVGFLFS